MNPGAAREEAILVEALALPSATRRAFIVRQCGSDDDTANRVIGLLDGYQENSAFLEIPAGVALQGEGDDFGKAAAGPEPGDWINRYHLRERIGEGGFGVVYLAEQEEPVRRFVALKVIRLGLDTQEFIARFEAERQALALMDHPNIARVFDAGATDSGRPYLVMELIRGIRITTYCDEHRLTVRARIDLFLEVCSAIQHAHQKGVIHRDLKPSNVLIELPDPAGHARPKIIDFGIAKATRERLTEKTLHTRIHTLIGTPAYTSPEQMEMSGLDVDTRSDIYSLGVLLYELLTGHQPFDREVLEAASLEDMRRLIREVDPPRPSQRVNALSSVSRTQIARQRGTEPDKLPPLLLSDLDWIVMRCLEKDRNRRYETANALAMDLRRHLANEPVVARPPSWTYRSGKFVRRNRTWAIAGTSIAVALIGGLALAFTGFARARVQQQAAETARREAEDLVGFMVRDLKPELQRTGRSPLTAQVSEKAVRYFSALPPDPAHPTTERNRAIALEALAYVRAYAGNAGSASALWHESFAARQRAATGTPDDPLLAGELALSEFIDVARSWPLVLSEAPGPGSPEVDGRLGAIVERAQKACGGHVADPTVARVLARVLACRSRYLFQTSTRPEEGLATGRAAEKLYRDLLARYPADSSLGAEFVRLLDNLSAIATERPESSGLAVPVAQEALTFAEAELNKNPANIEFQESAAYAAIELSYRQLGFSTEKASAAAVLARERWGALVAIDPQNFFYQHRFAWAHQMEGHFLFYAGRLVEAQQADERFVNLLAPIASFPSDFLELRSINSQLAAQSAQLNDAGAAQRHLAQIEIWHRRYLASLPPEIARQPGVTITYLTEQCALLDSQEAGAEAEKKARAVLQAVLAARHLDPRGPAFVSERTEASYCLGRALLRQGSGGRAVEVLRDLVADLEGPDGQILFGADASGAILQFKDLLGEALFVSGQAGPARTLLEANFIKWQGLGIAMAADCQGPCLLRTRNAVLLAGTLDPAEPGDEPLRLAALKEAATRIASRKTGDPFTREESAWIAKFRALSDGTKLN